MEGHASGQMSLYLWGYSFPIPIHPSRFVELFKVDEGIPAEEEELSITHFGTISDGTNAFLVSRRESYVLDFFIFYFPTVTGTRVDAHEARFCSGPDGTRAPPTIRAIFMIDKAGKMVTSSKDDHHILKIYKLGIRKSDWEES